MSNITLLSHQVQHVDNIKNAFNRLHGVIDTSTMGNGKTYTTSYLSHILSLPMLVICPASIVDVRKRMESVGATFVGIYSYESIRGAKSKQGRFPFLSRQDTKSGITYSVSEEFYQWINYGILLVLDESSKVKNKHAATTIAVATLIRAIISTPSPSRYIMLSATPYDKKEFMVGAFYTLGYTKHPSLSTYDISTGTHDPAGLKEVIDVCKYIDRAKTDEVLESHPMIGHRTKVGTANTIAMDLFLEVIKPHMIYSMPSPAIEREVAAIYANMSKLEFDRYSIAVRHLQELLLFCDDDVTVEMTNGVMEKLSLMLRDIEHAKVCIFVRKAVETLTTIPNSKVIVNFNY